MPASDQALTETNNPPEPYNYSSPTKWCDIVMKGGITSGVVYPLAVCKLATTYKFKCIGGTSAGAIAAAATAAAELGRHKAGAGFAELEKLPGWLGESVPDGKNSNLFSLFQPQMSTKPLFSTLTAALGSKQGRLSRLVLAGLKSFPIIAILGALPGLFLGLLTIWQGKGLLLIWGLVSAVLLIIVGIGLSVSWTFVKRAISAIPANYYGLCTGFASTHSNSAPPLTTWLTNFLDKLAGNENLDNPLTFGDLWGTKDPKQERLIDLQMMTTNLTHGRPYRLPFEEKIFYFDPAELEKFFPENVVKWMKDHPRETAHPERYAPLCPLPEAADLPVVVAVRLSLSFPILVSAVPLHAIDYSLKVSAGESHQPERCWFSDGGISSNFPVHFFDQPLPGRPTFALNLRPFQPDRPRDKDESQNVWMPKSNLEGIAEWWDRFDDNSGLGQLTGFFGAIINTMQNWRDNTQTRVPGYRDRVAHVFLDDNEGGLNLNMPPDLIDTLGTRGYYAGARLVEHFATPPGTTSETSWENHRWVRYRSTMSVIADMLRGIYERFTKPMPGDLSYAELIQRENDDLPGYKWEDIRQRAFAIKATTDLMELAEQWSQAPESFSSNAPKPLPELRITPRI